MRRKTLKERANETAPSRRVQRVVSPPMETAALNCLCELVGSPPGCAVPQKHVTTAERIAIIKRYLQAAYDEGKRANVVAHLPGDPKPKP